MYRCWAPPRVSPGEAHALAEWLDGIGLFMDAGSVPPLEPGDPSLMMLLFGRPDRWADPGPIEAHLRQGGPALLDAEAALSADLGVEGVRLPAEPGSDADAPAAYVTTSGPRSVAVGGFSATDIVTWLLGAQGDGAHGESPLDRSPYGPVPAECTTPVLDAYGEVVWSALGALAAGRGGIVLRRHPLPGGHGPALCLSHDVDGLGRSARSLAREAGSALSRGAVHRSAAAAVLAAVAGAAKQMARWGVTRKNVSFALVRPLAGVADRLGVASSYVPRLKRMLDAEQAVGAKSTVLFLDNKSWENSDYSLGGSALQEALDIARAADSEIGLHGTLQSATHEGDLSDEVRVLSRLGGGTVSVTRQHHLLTNPSLRRRQRDAGMQVDASAGFNHQSGYRVGTTRPFVLYDPATEAPLGLWEMPLVVMDTVVSEGAHGREISDELARVTDTISGFEGVVSTNWHPNFVAGDASGDEAFDAYRDLLNRTRERGGSFWTIGGFVGWWRARRSVSLDDVELRDGTLSATLNAGQDVEDLGIEAGGVWAGSIVMPLKAGRNVVALAHR